MSDTPTPRDVGAASLILEMNKWHGACPAFSEAQAYMDAILSALTAAGYVVVPREPTGEMENACIRASLGYLALHALKSIWPWHNRRHVRGNIRACYRAMIAAATKESEG